MSDDPKDVPPEDTPQDPVDNPPADDKVSIESYRKLLDEKKKFQKKLEEHERAAKERSETELREKERFKELSDEYKKQADEFKTKFESSEREKQDFKKMGALLRNMSGEVPQQYWGLIDLDKITIDDTTGAPDEVSVKKAARDFEKLYPEVIKTKAPKPGMPNDAPRTGGKLTYDEWLKLDYKDQLKRQKDVVLD
jgi:hypothetical protein